MEYRKATKRDAESVFALIHNTIKTVYPKYYPKEVTDFFCQHHNRNSIIADIEKEQLNVLFSDGCLVGTGSIIDNHITRVYVLPDWQGRGYGSYIMQQLENEITEKCDFACLDASLPASCFYEHRGYKTIRHEKIQVENGVYLVYEIMERDLRRKACQN